MTTLTPNCTWKHATAVPNYFSCKSGRDLTQNYCIRPIFRPTKKWLWQIFLCTILVTIPWVGPPPSRIYPFDRQPQQQQSYTKQQEKLPLLLSTAGYKPDADNCGKAAAATTGATSSAGCSGHAGADAAAGSSTGNTCADSTTSCTNRYHRSDGPVTGKGAFTLSESEHETENAHWSLPPLSVNINSAIHKATGLTVPGRSMIWLVQFHCSTIPLKNVP